MKIVTIIGARPQFIKAAAVSRAIAFHNENISSVSARIEEVIVHTGQHYDHSMSRVFFEDLEIPEPRINLGIGSGSHGQQTGQMLIQIESVLQKEKPDWVMVYGDTNSTLAGALAAVKLHIPVAHVEAGLRSFNRIMPEEHNRVLTDHCAELLFCPTQTAVDNLRTEGISNGVHLVGDVMYDSVLFNTQLAEKKSHILDRLDLEPGQYVLATVHRAENTDDANRLSAIFSAFEEISSNHFPVIVPMHPRTKIQIKNHCIQLSSTRVIEPVSYLDMLLLEKEAKLIMTDSGGVQKEAYWMKVPCITLRDETEWVETVESKWNTLAGTDAGKIVDSVKSNRQPNGAFNLFGDGKASEKIISHLVKADTISRSCEDIHSK